MINYLIQVLFVGLITFGGGQSFVPVLNNMLVTQIGLFTSIEFAQLIALVNAFPGPVGTKVIAYASYVYANGNIVFVMVALIVLQLPATIIMVMITKYFKNLKTSIRLKMISNYIKPIIIALFGGMVITFLWDTTAYTQNVTITAMIFLSAYYGIAVVKLNVYYLLIAGGLIGYLLF